MKMLISEVISVCCENHMKCVNKVCGQNAKFLNVKHLVHVAVYV
jgi:hypothetical protein